MEYVRIFLICSFFFVAVSGDQFENVTIEFVTADVIEHKGELQEKFHPVCKLPDKEREQFCKKVLQEDFAVRNNIKYVEGGPLGPELKYLFILNDGLKALLLQKKVLMTACSCPTTPVIYLRNDFNLPTAVMVYAQLPWKAHGYTT